MTSQVMKTELIDFPRQATFELLVREEIEGHRVYALWNEIGSLLYAFSEEVRETVKVAVQGSPADMTCRGVGSIPILSGGQHNTWNFDFGFEGEIWIDEIGPNNGQVAPGAYICATGWDPLPHCLYKQNKLCYINPDDSNSCSLNEVEDLFDQINWEVITTRANVRVTPKDHMPFEIQEYNNLGQNMFRRMPGVSQNGVFRHTPPVQSCLLHLNHLTEKKPTGY